MRTKRILSIVLTLAMLLGMFPGMSLTASAEGNTTTITPGTDEAKTGTGTMTITLKIKAMTVSASDVTATADGQPHGITVNVTDPATGYTVKYGTEEGSYTLEASPTQTEVGEKTVYYQVTADNYATYTGSAKVTVSAKSAQTITASDVTATYGDTGKKIEASTNGDGGLSYAVKSGDAVTVDASGNLTIVKAGSAVITVTAAETDTYAQATKDVNVTVNTKAMTVSASDVTATADGQPHGITVNVTDPATGYTVKYGTEEGSYTLEASPTQTEVGEKTVYYQVTADNYTTYTGSAKVTVSAKQTQTITAENVTAAYGDTGKSIEASTSGDGTLSYAVKSGDAVTVNETTGSLTIVKVGSAVITVTASETATYTQATKEVTVTINKANAVTATVTANNRTYDGTEKPLVTVTGEPTGGEMLYALGTATEATEQYTASIPTGTEADTYYVWYKAKGDVNHNDSEAGCVSVTVYTKTYTVTYKVVGGTWSDDSTTDKTETVVSGSKPASAPTGMKASEGYTGGAWDTNPTETTITGATIFTYIFTSKSTATITKIPTAKSLTYTGSAQELVTAGEATGGTMQYALGTATEATEQYTTSISTASDAGNYYVWYKAVGDANHNDSEAAFVSVQIASKIEAKVTFKVVNGSWDDGTTEDKTVTLTGKQGDTLKLLADQIPTVGNKPNDTYKSGSWDVAPSTDTAITTATTYTYIYAQNDVAPQPQPEPQPQPHVTPSIAIDGGDFELIKGSTKNLTVKLVPEGTAVTYSSSNEEIAAVDSEGRVIANSVGTAVITAKITVEEKDYTSSVTVTVTEESTKESTIVSSELTDGNIPDVIKAQGLDTKEKVEQKLVEALSISSEQKENIAVRDVRLIIKENGVERAATAEDFPEDGLDVLLEYPEGTNKDDFIFNVAHMIAETVGGYQAGSVETPGCSNTDEGIRTKFHGLSPVLITWSKRDSSEPVEKKESHVHEFAWDTVAATEDQDGELRYQCKECGHILTRVPLSAYYVFNANAVEKITKAKQGETVKVTTDRWISFHKMVFDALAARPDVSLEVSFLDEEYKGNRVSFTIPAAADTSDLFTEDNFVGFMYLGNKYGLMAEEN